ncbi:MAG: hypothetical protein MSH48_01125 [Mollicutes bacterium]|nr:hypothetical protein [Mollicutes bacterium]
MKNDFKLIISLLQNTRFKVTIIILALLSFMAFGSITNKMTIVDGIYNILTWNFFIMVLLFLFLFNAYNIITETSKNYSFLIRIKNYKEFISKIIKFIFISNLIIYLIVLFLLLIISVLRTGMNLQIDSYGIYNIDNLVYLIFHIIRSYFILNMLVVILVSLYKLVKEEIVVILSGILPISIVALTPFISEKKITSVFKLPLYYGEYFIKNNYETFIFEICMSLLFISVLALISKILIEVTSKRKIDLAI